MATVGRRESSAVRLQDTGVSGQHCQIAYNADEAAWKLVDLGSTNGTSLNRVQIVAHKGASGAHTLCTGDRVTWASTRCCSSRASPLAPRPQTHKHSADVTADEIVRRLAATPLPASIRDSIRELELPGPRTRACCIQKQAAKSRNKTRCEDTFSNFAPTAGLDLAALCVADGHCGAETSLDIQRKLPDMLSGRLQTAQGGGSDAAPERAAASLQDALTQTFAALDGAIEGQDGSTMTLLVVRGDDAGAVHLQAANVGDSAIVCADFARMVKYHLTDNHRVTAPAELQRLRDTGAILTHNETRLMGLNLSRSIGDRPLKELNSGFTAEPYVSKVHTVAPSEELLVVLASDGLWDVTNANLVMRIAFRVLSDHPGDVRLLAQVLMEHAVSRRSKDDITIVVLQVAAARDGAAVAGAHS